MRKRTALRRLSLRSFQFFFELRVELLHHLRMLLSHVVGFILGASHVVELRTGREARFDVWSPGHYGRTCHGNDVFPLRSADRHRTIIRHGKHVVARFVGESKPSAVLIAAVHCQCVCELLSHHGSKRAYSIDLTHQSSAGFALWHFSRGPTYDERNGTSRFKSTILPPAPMP